jgi:hypothetical protein
MLRTRLTIVSRKEEAVMIPSIQIDPAFSYYARRSPDSIAEELALAGYRIVHIFVTNELEVDGRLVEALRRKGLQVWALTLGNGTFGTSHLPAEWHSWQMGLLREPNDGYARLSPFCSAYVAWKKQVLAQLVKKLPFDGLEIAEPYLPEWNGLETGTYGDVGPHARAAFREKYGADPPEFRDKTSPAYYRKQPQLYADWVQFRVDGVNGYVDEIINGAEGVRAARPGILIATWTLAVDAGADSVAKLRELQGNDAAAMIDRVRPDLHYLQTHWPDWTRASLSARYVRSYRPFVESIRKAHPSLPLGIQTDIGSAKRMIRSRAWLEAYVREVQALGGATWTAYEYTLGGAQYDEAPRLLAAQRTGARTATLSFHKRVAPCSPVDVRIALRSGGNERQLRVISVETDGNRVRLTVGEGWEANGKELGASGFADTPELLLFPPLRPNRSHSYDWVPLD